MNRSLITGIALTAGLGLAGVAQAQTTQNPADTATTPAITSPNPAGAATTEGMQTPQAGSTNPSMSDSATQTPGSSASSDSGMSSNGAMTTPNSGNSSAEQANQQTAPSASHAKVREAQQALKSKGLYHGPIDGVVGRATKTALSRFQQENGLPQTAMLDEQTMRRLISGGNADTGGNTETR